MAGVTTRGVLLHTPVNHTVFSYDLDPSRTELGMFLNKGSGPIGLFGDHIYVFRG